MMSKATSEIILETPIGFVKLVHSDLGLKEIQLDRKYNDNPEIIAKSFNKMSVRVVQGDVPISGKAAGTVGWIEHFFNPSLRECPAPDIDNDVVNRDNFTGRVLRTLMANTGPGTTVSYAGLADMCGSPKACRAVGQAMRANPCPLLIPCHRVVASNGGLGHYMSGKGDNIKSWLLEFEKSQS